MLYRVEGIVIRTMDYGEGNKIITLFTKEAGKQSVMARGAKKIKSRHAAATQLFTHAEFVYFKSGQMGTLNQAEIIHAHQPLREDLHKSAYASYLAEMATRMTEDAQQDLFLFEQISAGLTAFEEGKDPAVVIHIFELQMLAMAGYAPELNVCVSCGRGEELIAFSHRMGGALCRSCRIKEPYALETGEAPIALLRKLRSVDLRRLGHVNLKPETVAAVTRHLRGYMDEHVGVKWKARAFIEQMEKYGI